MSRIGNKPIEISEGISVTVSDQIVTVKGPKGELSQKIDKDIKIKLKDNLVLVERPTDQKRHKSMHGLYRSLINNMLLGVIEGYTKELELVGVGYKATTQGNILELSVGHSHN
ncbi:MAG: 50S ribosomal protein L6, partial [Bacteroidetes bacterium]|nr:50S ribosomal protein L6 [Bacteroidota bacterium]